MADFNPAFETMIRNEGGFKLTDISGDRGGQTYAGIARNFHGTWPGWRYVDGNDLGNADLTVCVRDFYKAQFWDRICGDKITQQGIAESIFDFAVNAGPGVAAKLAQLVVNTVPNGAIGAKTLEQMNAIDPGIFNLKYALAKVA